MWKVNGRLTPSDGKSSHCLRQGELKTVLAKPRSEKLVEIGIELVFSLNIWNKVAIGL